MESKTSGVEHSLLMELLEFKDPGNFKAICDGGNTSCKRILAFTKITIAALLILLVH